MLALAEGASLPQWAFLLKFWKKTNANEFVCSGYFHSVMMMSSSEVRNITVLGYHLSFFLLRTFSFCIFTKTGIIQQKKCIHRVFLLETIFSQHLTQLLGSYLLCRAAINIMRTRQICDETGLTLNLA
jgi:hypothetical protein